MDIPGLVIIFLCLLVLIVYLKTKRYDSLQGLIMVLLALSALFIKFYSKGFPNLLNPSTFTQSGIVIMGFTLLLCLFIVPFRKKRINLKFALILLPLYLFFGLLQQLLFQYLFLDSANAIIGNLWLSVLVGATFYLAFHFGSDFDTRFRISLFIIDIIWGYCYLTYNNLFWLGISHGIFGMAYYTLVVKRDPLKNRFGEKTRKIVPKY
jgi:hypothetical protein